jgi:hypothetical protein
VLKITIFILQKKIASLLVSWQKINNLYSSTFIKAISQKQPFPTFEKSEWHFKIFIMCAEPGQKCLDELQWEKTEL